MSINKKQSKSIDKMMETIVMCVIVDLGVLSLCHTIIFIFHVHFNDLMWILTLIIIVVIDLLIVLFGNKAFGFLMKIVRDLHYW